MSHPSNSIVTPIFAPGEALRDDPKNGCEGDYQAIGWQKMNKGVSF